MFQKQYLGQDLLASVVVFLVALPLCMGIAIASGVPPALGLITGIIGGIIAASLSGCPLQVSGPAAGLSVIVFQIVEEHGLKMLGPIVLLAGITQAAAGLLRGGQLFRSISPAVIHGMLAGIGILIFSAQFHVMVDHKPLAGGVANLAEIPNSVMLLFQDLDHDHHMAAIIGFATLSVMVFWTYIGRGFLKSVPAALVAVGLGTVLAKILQPQIHYVQLPDRLTDAVTIVALGGLTGLFTTEIITESLALAFIASAETLLSAAAVDQMAKGRQKTNYDRELLSQGVGNMLAGFLGSLPMTGVIVRSAANVNAGARTRLSAMLHGAWLLILVVFFPQVLQMVPTASLAAILVYTGVKLVNIKTLRHLHQYGWAVVAITLITMTIIVCFSLLTGIIVGIVLSLIKLLWAISKLEVKMSQGDGRVDVYFSGSASFVNLPRFSDALDTIPVGSESHIHIRGLNYIDHAAMETLANWEKVRTANGDTVNVEWEELMSFYQRTHQIKVAKPA